MSSNESSDKTGSERFWTNLAARYWPVIVLFGILMAGAIVGFILTLDWYVRISPIGGFGSWTLGDFSLGEAILWCLYLFLWTLLFVILPTLGVGGIIVAAVWFGVLPPDIKEEIRSRPRRARRGRGGGGAVGFLLFIGLCIKVWIDGNWFTKFASLPYGYFIQSLIIVGIWELIILGIPAAAIGMIWLVAKRQRT